MVLYLANKNPYAAKVLYERIKDAAASLINNPYIGRPGRVPGTRELVIPNTHAEVETTEIRPKGDVKACPSMPLLVDSVSFS